MVAVAVPPRLPKAVADFRAGSTPRSAWWQTRSGRRVSSIASALGAIAAALIIVGADAKPSIYESYRTALAARVTPENMEFLYTVTRSGSQRIVTEQHRVYWTAAGLERNDTISINGTNLVPPRSKMLHRSEWPYDVGQFAVSSDDYTAEYSGKTIVGNRQAFVLKLTRATPADFTMKALYVDAITRLPLRQTFTVNGGDCQGDGVIEFLPAGGHWLPSFVSVICTANGQSASAATVYKEAIRFSGYRFPAAIPPDVFGQSAPQAPVAPATSGSSDTGAP